MSVSDRIGRGRHFPGITVHRGKGVLTVTADGQGAHTADRRGFTGFHRVAVHSKLRHLNRITLFIRVIGQYITAHRGIFFRNSHIINRTDMYGDRNLHRDSRPISIAY